MHVEPSTCPVCKKVFDPLRSRALSVSSGRVRAFCSDTCRATDEAAGGADGVGAVVDAVLASSGQRGSRPWTAAVIGGLLCAAALVAITLHRARARTIEPVAALAEAAVDAPSFTVADALRVLQAHQDAEAVQAGVPERDLWLHPLAGPERRLPIRASRKFRAPRDHESPDECGSGHCGVDLGEQSGEWVFAAHDGVVERVVLDDVGLGGRYVRLNHRGGTLTTSYMHLGTVRSELRPGTPVRAGDPIGTVGDTGINHSGPHLHFQIGVRAHPGDLEAFIDPEPLLLTWVMRPAMPERPARKLARSTRTEESGPQGM